MQAGLSYLQNLLSQTHSRLRVKANPIPLYSLISQLISSLREYVQSDCKGSWVDNMLRDRKSTLQPLFLESWIAHSMTSLQCQLLAGLSISDDRRKLQLYLRLRKYIVQLLSSQKLDELLLRHEDAITIIHRMFPQVVRKEISRGIKQMFIKFKVTDAKIYACVFIEYILSVYDNIGEEEQSLMMGQTKTTSQIQISNFSSIQNFTSNLNKNQGVRCVGSFGNEVGFNIIEAKFLPQQMEMRKANFSQEGNESYYYSNSINYSQDLSRKYAADLSQSQDQSNFTSEKENINLNKSGGIKLFQSKNKILIQESKKTSRFTSLAQNENRVPSELQQLVTRNKQFKERMLSGGQSEIEMSHEEQSSINHAINIIHNTVVRNHHYGPKRYLS